MTPFRRILFSSVVAAVILGIGMIGYTLRAPADFATGSIVVISQGSTTAHIAEQLQKARVIAYPQALEAVLMVTGESARVRAGAYLFEKPEGALSIARRLASGDYGIPPARITFPEGITVREMGEKIDGELMLVSADAFVTAAKPYEGYLFPDTYSFAPSVTLDEVIATLRGRFDTQVAPLEATIKASGHTKTEIVTMASLVEKEARTEVNRKLVAGVLWNRIKAGMPLQVDAVFGYINNRDTYSPSFADLKIDSPYNTYLYKGLPPTPICSPSLESIDAALHPTSSKYLFYLTGTDDQMHYATTYAEHLANQKKYLK